MKNNPTIEDNGYFYFIPQIEIIDSINSKNEYRSYISQERKYIQAVDDLYSYDLAIVLSEPGNGKSRLLKEVVLKAEVNSYEAFYLDLKKCDKTTISDKIKELLRRKTPLPKTNAEINAIKDFCCTQNFGDSSNPHIICLDALDEVKDELMYDYIDKIKQFCADNPAYKVVVSCRGYIYRDYDTILKEVKPVLMEIKPFNGYMITQYLLRYKISEEDAHAVIKHFYREYKLEVINSPRILEVFTSIAVREGVAKTLKKNKAELLEAFIYGKLDAEEKKVNANKKDIIKRVLEKLALVMEIYQSNQIRKDDLLTFFDDIKSNLSSTFLSQVQIEYFYNRSLLIPSSDGQHIQFENAEFQEYLAAKEITRLGRTDQILFDLTVEKKLREIIPSWANTMKYFFELEPKVQPSIIDFISKKNNYHNSDLLEQILISDAKYLESISAKERDGIFKKIFDLYQSNNWYLRSSLLNKLVSYFSIANEDNLKTALCSKNPVQKRNAISLIERLFSKKKLEPVDFYKKELLKAVKKDLSFNNQKSAAIKALAAFNDLKIIKNNYKYFENANNDAIYSFLQSATKVDPNNSFTIDLILRYTLQNRLSVVPAVNLDKVTSYEGIKYYLKKLQDNEELYNSFRLHPPDSESLENMMANISAIYSPEIKELLKSLIFLARRRGDEDSFTNRALNLLDEKETNFLLEIVEDIKASGTYTKNWYTFNLLFADLITKENVLLFIKKIKEIPDSKFAVENLMISTFMFSSEAEKKEIYSITKPFFKKAYSHADKTVQKRNKNNAKADLKRYYELLNKIEPSPGKYMPNVFKFYDDNRKLLSKFITDNDRKRIKKLLTDVALKFDFSKASLKVKDKSETGGSSFTYSNMIPIFEEASQLFNEFEIDLKEYRPKLLEFIPYAFSYNNKLTTLFSLLGDLEESEIDNLLKFYNTPRKDDLISHNISTFFTICETYRIFKAIPILKKIVLSSDYEHYSRTQALKLIQALKPDNDFYMQVFKAFQSSDKLHENSFLLLANEYLIINDSNHKKIAIDWRINKLLNSPVEREINPDYDPFYLDHVSSESGDLGKPLNLVNDTNYIATYLKLLDEAIKLYSHNIKYQAYATYLWEIAFTYFDNLKSHRSYTPFEEIEKKVTTYAAFKGFSKLQTSLFKLRINYVKVLSKPLSLNECIKTYNTLKSNQYNKVNTANDFYFVIQDLIEKDIKNWVEQEGAYHFLKDAKLHEHLIQKTIKTQFENGLLRRGFREDEVRIRREEQLLDNLRTDFVISFGFIGQVLIEIKLTKNKDIKDKTYHKKLLQYIDGTKSDFGIYLIFQTDDEEQWILLEPEIKKQYDPLSDKIKVIGLDCTKTS